MQSKLNLIEFYERLYLVTRFHVSIALPTVYQRTKTSLQSEKPSCWLASEYILISKGL